jgi:SAM-dependent methyltransferase
MRGETTPSLPSGRHIAITVTTEPPPRHAIAWFDRQVAASAKPGSTVLNIGAGSSRSGRFPKVRSRAGVVVGIDPDQGIQDNRCVDETWQTTLEDFAPQHPAAFDAAFSVFVLEHVADPEGFVRAAATVLKPGGSLLCLTVNKWHYFGLTTWATTRLGISDWLLGKLRDPDLVRNYHFPTEYRMNTIGSLAHLLGDAGFRAAEFRMWDLPALYEPYLPARLSGIASRWQTLAYHLNNPHLMGNLTVKATR